MNAEKRLTEQLLLEHFGKDTAELAAARERLAAHEPLAYIIGEWYFYDQSYKITPDCLIPRPDTEHVVDCLIKLLPGNGCFADLCTGSGCIAISALVHRADCTAYAADISRGAVDTARYNAEMNGVSDRIEIACADVFDISHMKGRRFDCIVSNPPYIASNVISSLSEEVKREPRAALDGGKDGLDFYRFMIPEYLDYLNEGGSLIFEIGYDQANDIKALCCDTGAVCVISKDYGGNDRVAVIKKT